MYKYNFESSLKSKYLIRACGDDKRESEVNWRFGGGVAMFIYKITTADCSSDLIVESDEESCHS